MKQRLRNLTIRRMFIQAMTAVLINSHFSGYMTGKIYGGNSKQVCVPVLNCYSCPGARGACPIGSLQAVLGSSRHKFSFYVLGLLMLFGITMGRWICGFLCPFGWLQDLLYKIKSKKVKVVKAIDRPLRYLKYVVLVVAVILLPLFATNEFGIAPPYFCEFICPAGTLGAGVPLTILNEGLRSLIGSLFFWKMTVLVIILVLSVVIYRPFCKYLCPLGAFYGLFNRISFMRMYVDETACIHCGACTRQCKMGVDVLKNINSAECIRCGECKAVCPTGAIHNGTKEVEHKCTKE